MSEAPKEDLGALKANRSCLGMLIILAVILSAPILLIYMGCFSIGPFGIVNQADAGFRRAKKHIDPEQLRAWAFAMVQSHNGTNGYEHHVKKSEMPDYILNLYSSAPSALVSSRVTDQEPLVSIIWGGGFFGWGLVVGTTNFSTSSTGDSQVAEWTSGIYYVHEGNQKIR